MLTAIFLPVRRLAVAARSFGSDAEKEMMLLVLAQLMFIYANVIEIKGILRERIYEH